MEQYTRNQKILWGIGTVVVLFYALIPVIWILSLSLKTPETIGDQSFWPKEWTLENYSAVFEEGLGFNRAIINSIGIALITTVLALAFASMAAYAITRLDFPGKTLILAGALAVSMFPAISVVGGLFNVWRVVGLYDTWPGLILPYLSFALPLSIYTLSAFFREIPWDLEKAAQMDGATGMQAFRRVILPLAMPGVFTAGILAFIAAWNDFLFANVLTSTDAARTAPVALSFFRGASQFTDPSGAIAAGAVVVTIPILIMVLIFQRRIVSGLTSGAVKG
ncbi:carbohydrate ABC transporter permease [Solirubrobacter sp. CPCC 204708]|uniref:Carbohydrate ABC transporter permease n=1 Tax=Solirubrobacter deserti TaxID=2282478 RepID=A0ABT4RU62_9ACTN|nr:carbohydrate ABC transporter permease [Solirubrobacter deserti]MBE2316350.1 carbohydrate ABC transporter permease [Solirubrobacter deserti]MDA0142119.1 carbohydrate ABC transporter permease [Solirubrobacter deserti]